MLNLLKLKRKEKENVSKFGNWKEIWHLFTQKSVWKGVICNYEGDGQSKTFDCTVVSCVIILISPSILNHMLL